MFFFGTPVDEMVADRNVADARKLFTNLPCHPIDAKFVPFREVQDEEAGHWVGLGCVCVDVRLPVSCVCQGSSEGARGAQIIKKRNPRICEDVEGNVSWLAAVCTTQVVPVVYL